MVGLVGVDGKDGDLPPLGALASLDGSSAAPSSALGEDTTAFKHDVTKTIAVEGFETTSIENETTKNSYHSTIGGIGSFKSSTTNLPLRVRVVRSNFLLKIVGISPAEASLV